MSIQKKKRNRESNDINKTINKIHFVKIDFFIICTLRSLLLFQLTMLVPRAHAQSHTVSEKSVFEREFAILDGRHLKSWCSFYFALRRRMRTCEGLSEHRTRNFIHNFQWCMNFISGINFFFRLPFLPTIRENLKSKSNRRPTNTDANVLFLLKLSEWPRNSKFNSQHLQCRRLCIHAPARTHTHTPLETVFAFNFVRSAQPECCNYNTKEFSRLIFRRLTIFAFCI